MATTTSDQYDIPFAWVSLTFMVRPQPVPVRIRPCNRMQSRLQPYVLTPATVCTSAGNRRCSLASRCCSATSASHSTSRSNSSARALTLTLALTLALALTLTLALTVR